MLKDDKKNKNIFIIKLIVLTIYNLIIVWIVAAINWDDWGAIVIGITLMAIILLGTPLLTWILFLKSNKKNKIILFSMIATICISWTTSFIANDNILNIINNSFLKNQINEIVNNKLNIKFNSNDKFNAYINPKEKKIYFVFHNSWCGQTLNIIQKDCRLEEYDIVESNSINESSFNNNILYTKNINYDNYNITINVKYIEYHKKEINIKINDIYYKVTGKDQMEYNWDRILDNNLIQYKLFTITGVESYENREPGDPQYIKDNYTFFEYYSTDDFEYFIVKDKNKNYNFYNDVERIYKSFSKDKTDLERLNEFEKMVKEKYDIHDGSKVEIISTKTFNINNDKIDKIIVYDDEYQNAWIEIIIKKSEFSIFTRMSNMPAIDRREVK